MKGALWTVAILATALSAVSCHVSTRAHVRPRCVVDVTSRAVVNVDETVEFGDSWKDLAKEQTLGNPNDQNLADMLDGHFAFDFDFGLDAVPRIEAPSIHPHLGGQLDCELVAYDVSAPQHVRGAAPKRKQDAPADAMQARFLHLDAAPQPDAPDVALQLDAPGAVPQLNLDAPDVVLQLDAPDVALQLDAPDVALQLDAPNVALQLDAPDVTLQLDAPDVALQLDAPDVTLRLDAPDVALQLDAPDVTLQLDAPDVALQLDAPNAAPQLEAPRESVPPQRSATRDAPDPDDTLAQIFAWMHHGVDMLHDEWARMLRGVM